MGRGDRLDLGDDRTASGTGPDRAGEGADRRARSIDRNRSGRDGASQPGGCDHLVEKHGSPPVARIRRSSRSSAAPESMDASAAVRPAARSGCPPAEDASRPRRSGARRRAPPPPRPMRTSEQDRAFSAGPPPARAAHGNPGEPELLGDERHGPHPPVVERRDHALAGRGQLVEPATVHHEGPLPAECGERLRDGHDESRVVDPEELGGGAGRVQKRTEEVEDRPYPQSRAGLRPRAGGPGGDRERRR